MKRLILALAATLFYYGRAHSASPAGLDETAFRFIRRVIRDLRDYGLLKSSEIVAIINTLEEADKIAREGKTPRSVALLIRKAYWKVYGE